VMKNSYDKGRQHSEAGGSACRNAARYLNFITKLLTGAAILTALKEIKFLCLARVIAVADTFDALTTNRPYQHAYPPEEALKIIHSLAGKRLDPEAGCGAGGSLRTRRDSHSAQHRPSNAR